MRVTVIGAGLIGLTSAYFLRRRGHDVTVIDRQSGPGRETSFANGGLLTPSMAEPWNTPGCWRVLLRALVSPDSSLRLRLDALPGMTGWGLAFLRNSGKERFSKHALINLRFALYSLRVLESLREQTGIAYTRAGTGSLRIFRDPASLDAAWAAAARRLEEGLTARRLSRSEVVALEPALEPISSRLAGGIHYADDETGDAHQFCLALTDQLRVLGVELLFDTCVRSLEMASGRLAAVVTDRGRLLADRYVVAAGSHTGPLLNRIGVSVPVQPAKGYSVTFANGARVSSLRIPVVDDELHAVVVPVGDALRVAGTAEFAGYDLTLSNGSVQSLLKLVRQVLPEVDLDFSSAQPWCGLRPMSARGNPVIGPTRIDNVFVNTGHGHLGWTLAAGSGQLLADWVDGTPPAVDPTPFRLK